MNYRHAYHAGSHTEVFKHSVLVLLLQHLLKKPQPFMVFDTHAGAGIYDLTADEAAKTGEALAGIGSVTDKDVTTASAYLDFVRRLNPTALRSYPGSPEGIPPSKKWPQFDSLISRTGPKCVSHGTFQSVVAEPANDLREIPLSLPQSRIIRIGLELLVDYHQLSFPVWPPGSQVFLRGLLFLQNWTIDSDLSCRLVDDDIIRVRNRLWPGGAAAGALCEDGTPVFLVVDSGLENLHSCRASVCFGTDHKVQIISLRMSIAIGCSDGDFAQNSLDDRNLLDPIAFADGNRSIGFLDRQGLYAIFESDSGQAVDFGADKRACLAWSSPGIARDALFEAMLNRRVPITAWSFFRGAIRVTHCTSSPDRIVEELP
jgi:23S rRNA (adenine(2030)-N(6))-methyltransferase RlmJ-like protein